MTAGVQVYREQRVVDAPAVARRRHVHWQPLTPAGVLSVTVVSLNLSWTTVHRRGLPFDIDEAHSVDT